MMQKEIWAVREFAPGIQLRARCTTEAEVMSRPRGDIKIDGDPFPYLVNVFDRTAGSGNQWSVGAQWNSLPWSWQHLDLHQSGYCSNCGREILATAIDKDGTALIAHAE